MKQLARHGALANAALSRGPIPQQPQQPQYPQQQPQYQGQMGSPIDTETARSMARQIGYGSEEEGAHALQQLAANIHRQVAAQQPHINPQEIAAFATQRAYEQMELNENLKVIGREFPALWNNEALAKTAALQLQQLRQRDVALGVVKPNLTLYREACHQVMEAARAATGAKPQPMVQNRSVPLSRPGRSSDYIERPASMRQQRRMAVQREEVADSIPVSGSDIVAKMRRQRGQYV
jgi:hypothetical protein